MPVWPCTVRAKRQATPADLLALPVRVLFTQGRQKEGEKPTDILPFNVAAVIPAREFCACWT
jgi:hypothetical protein